jgi:PIN domain nuclease of toxin-antitoxin system
LINTGNTILVSSIALREISLKHAAGKLILKNILPDELIKISGNIGFKFIELSPDEACHFYLLREEHHIDTFDRMLIWQALHNNYVFISSDKEVKKYTKEGLKVIS